MSYEVKVLCNHQRNNTYLLHNYFTQWLKYSLYFLVEQTLHSLIPVHAGQAGQQRKNHIANEFRSAAKGRVDRCPARAAAAVSAADPTFRPEYSAHCHA